MKLYKLFTLAIIVASFTLIDQKPTLYIIGDSTVKNGDGTGKGGQWGWATVVDAYFDTNRIGVRNHAIGGRSSRTFITDGRWDKILETLTKGDYVMMQFGHNDSSPLDDTARARGTIKGIGNDSVATYNPIRKMREVVYSYGWYMRKFVRETQAKGAIPIICSPVPRDNWKNGKIIRSEYALWAKQIAEETGAYFIDLHELVSLEYEKMDTAIVNKFFPADKTHTNKEGAILNAQQVVAGIKQLNKIQLKNFLLK
ncbi:MAG: rhamnogalacturonan acetylesterase [Sediminibacterium sp.]|nr:rhamnogalacturonan acetylesterase [Sediminibacterium sp.]